MVRRWERIHNLVEYIEEPLIAVFIPQTTYTCILYKEYRGVCPLVGIGTLPPLLSPASMPIAPSKGGGNTRLGVRGWGSPNSAIPTTGEKAKHSAYSMVCKQGYTLSDNCRFVCGKDYSRLILVKLLLHIILARLEWGLRRAGHCWPKCSSHTRSRNLGKKWMER